MFCDVHFAFQAAILARRSFGRSRLKVGFPGVKKYDKILRFWKL